MLGLPQFAPAQSAARAGTAAERARMEERMMVVFILEVGFLEVGFF